MYPTFSAKINFMTVNYEINYYKIINYKIFDCYLKFIIYYLLYCGSRNDFIRTFYKISLIYLMLWSLCTPWKIKN